MADGTAKQKPGDDPVAEYKRLLQQLINGRPSGTRQRLATAIGKNRSFISQISNPNYPTPIPVEHIDTIMQVCHFSPTEQAEFLDAYRRAHPRRLQKVEPATKRRRLELDVPDLGDPDANRAFDQAITDMAKRMAKLLRERK